MEIILPKKIIKNQIINIIKIQIQDPSQRKIQTLTKIIMTLKMIVDNNPFKIEMLIKIDTKTTRTDKTLDNLDRTSIIIIYKTITQDNFDRILIITANTIIQTHSEIIIIEQIIIHQWKSTILIDKMKLKLNKT